MYGFRTKPPVINGWLFVALVALLAGGASFFINLHSAHAAVTNYYISTGGNNSNPCTQSSFCQTINGVDARLGSSLPLGSSGTVIHVAPGTYSGPITTNKSGTASARIAYISDTKWGANILITSGVVWTVNGSYTDVNGFEMSPQGGNGICVDIPLPTVAVHDVHVLSNYCHDLNLQANNCANAGAFMIGGGSFANPDTHDNQIIGNVIRHNGNNSLFPCNKNTGIYSPGYRETIENNIVSGVAGWGIKLGQSAQTVQDAVTNNTVFNNGGGILLTQCSDTSCGTMDYMNVSNNIIVNNGIGSPTSDFGLNYYHVSGLHNVAANNLIYGNLPSDYAHHDVTCIGGTPISGTDANGTAGGCPSINPKSDPSVTATFTNFQTDTNTAPASSYNPANYELKSGSNAINNGRTACAERPGWALPRQSV